jgi:hypothetical protein
MRGKRAHQQAILYGQRSKELNLRRAKNKETKKARLEKEIFALNNNLLEQRDQGRFPDITELDPSKDYLSGSKTSLYPRRRLKLRKIERELENPESQDKVTAAYRTHLSKREQLSVKEYNQLIYAGAREDELPAWFLRPKSGETLLVSVDLFEVGEPDLLEALEEFKESGQKYLRLKIDKVFEDLLFPRNQLESFTDLDDNSVIPEGVTYNLYLDPRLGLDGQIKGVDPFALGLKRARFGPIRQAAKPGYLAGINK